MTSQSSDGSTEWGDIDFMPDKIAQPYVSTGQSVRVLTGWTPPLPSYQLYYSSRRHSPPAFLLEHSSPRSVQCHASKTARRWSHAIQSANDGAAGTIQASDQGR